MAFFAELELWGFGVTRTYCFGVSELWGLNRVQGFSGVSVLGKGFWGVGVLRFRVLGSGSGFWVFGLLIL